MIRCRVTTLVKREMRRTLNTTPLCRYAWQHSVVNLQFFHAGPVNIIHHCITGGTWIRQPCEGAPDKNIKLQFFDVSNRWIPFTVWIEQVNTNHRCITVGALNSTPQQLFCRGALEGKNRKKRNCQGLRRHVWYGSLKVVEISTFFSPWSGLFSDATTSATRVRASRWN